MRKEILKYCFGTVLAGIFFWCSASMVTATSMLTSPSELMVTEEKYEESHQ